ncbi:MAG: preprotein translocase subunit SecG [Elusimicrobiales bacterium]|nr:preprotein translocase subunit SecG [Elusimicrobiales bacterium]
MYTLIVTLHVILAFVIIISILVFQTSKGSALSMFGGGGDALFNAASGTSFIKKFTAVAAGLFALTSILLTIFGANNRFRSVVMDPGNQLQAPPPQQQAAPAQPGAANPAPAAPAPAKSAEAPAAK